MSDRRRNPARALRAAAARAIAPPTAVRTGRPAMPSAPAAPRSFFQQAGARQIAAERRARIFQLSSEPPITWIGTKRVGARSQW